MSNKRQKTDLNRDELISWLFEDGRSTDGLGSLLEKLCLLMRRQGLALDRATLGAPLLHPIAQSTFCLWDVEDGLRVNSLIWDDTSMARVQNSPIHAIYTQGQNTDWRLASTSAADRFSIGPDLFDAGFTHYLALALPFSDGSHKAFTVQTKSAEGFSETEREFVCGLVPAISTVVEHHVQKALTKTLLDTFVGRRAGEHVLNGDIHRGDGEMINSVIWMCDLRGFTKFAEAQDPPDLLEALNVYFETVTNAIHTNGGEVLKFIGDAVLGIFTIDQSGERAVAQAEAAVEQVLSAKESKNWPTGLGLGIGLHKGEVFFGNVGGKTRLDFTVIGSAVNLVSRIEALCAETGRGFLVTEDVCSVSSKSYELLGQWSLKGVSAPVRVFAPCIDSTEH